MGYDYSFGRGKINVASTPENVGAAISSIAIIFIPAALSLFVEIRVTVGFVKFIKQS